MACRLTGTILLIRTLGTNFREILGKIHSFSFLKMRLKVSSVKRRPFCLGLNELKDNQVRALSLPMCVPNLRTIHPVLLSCQVNTIMVGDRRFSHKTIISPDPMDMGDIMKEHSYHDIMREHSYHVFQAISTVIWRYGAKRLYQMAPNLETTSNGLHPNWTALSRLCTCILYYTLEWIHF